MIELGTNLILAVNSILDVTSLSALAICLDLWEFIDLGCFRFATQALFQFHLVIVIGLIKSFEVLYILFNGVST